MPDISLTLNEIEQQIIDAVRGLQYGSVAVIVHDARVVQVERTEKTRFETVRKS